MCTESQRTNYFPVIALAYNFVRSEASPLLEHVSPIEWDNVILYGQYILDRTRVR